MPQPSTISLRLRPSPYRADPCDIEMTSELKVACFDAGIKPVCFYWNIGGQVVLTYWGCRNAVLAATPLAAIRKVEDQYGPL